MHRTIFMGFLTVCILLYACATAFASDFGGRVGKLKQVKSVRVSTSGDSAAELVRVVIDATGETEYKTFVLSSPTRIAVDIKGAWLPPTVPKTIDVGSGPVGKVRVSQFNADTVRIVVEANVGKDRYQVFALPPNDKAGKMWRLVMDFGDLGRVDLKKLEHEANDSAGAAAPTAPTARKIKYFDKPGLKGKIIAVDPGHGGSDSGAIGATGSMEKNVTLAIGLELKKMLEKAGAKVVMTRTKDVDVARPNATAREELQARVDAADRAGADVFVSIHMDAFVNRDANGTSTYIYEKTTGDARLGNFVREGVVKELKTNDRGTRASNIYVVKYTAMPATLVEVGFISNPAEEKMMMSPAKIKSAAKGIFNGLKRYFSAD